MRDAETLKRRKAVFRGERYVCTSYYNDRLWRDRAHGSEYAHAFLRACRGGWAITRHGGSVSTDAASASPVWSRGKAGSVVGDTRNKTRSVRVPLVRVCGSTGRVSAIDIGPGPPDET